MITTDILTFVVVLPNAYDCETLDIQTYIATVDDVRAEPVVDVFSSGVLNGVRHSGEVLVTKGAEYGTLQTTMTRASGRTQGVLPKEGARSWRQTLDYFRVGGA